MKDEVPEEVVKFVIAAVLGVALWKAAPRYESPQVFSSPRRRREQPDGYVLPGGQGHSFGQRMGKRRTQS